MNFYLSSKFGERKKNVCKKITALNSIFIFRNFCFSVNHLYILFALFRGGGGLKSIKYPFRVPSDH